MCTSRLLTKQLPRISSDDLKKRNSFKVINYLHRIQAYNLINKTFVEFMQIFFYQTRYFNITSFEHQIQLTVCILDFSKGLEYVNFRCFVYNFKVIFSITLLLIFWVFI